MQQIADWLEKLGLRQYAKSFAENGIDVSVLRHLTDQDLKDIGVLLGHRRKILAAALELGSTAQAATHNQANEPKHDAMPSAMLVLNAASPKECQRPVATDSKIIGPAPTGGRPWRERWTFDACGKRAEVDINFTPSPNGGTDWAASLVK